MRDSPVFHTAATKPMLEEAPVYSQKEIAEFIA